MKLQVGERLAGSGLSQQPGGYVVTDIVQETPWNGLYAGKKILYNFDFTSKRVRETDEKEWLDVFLRTIRYPHLDDPEYVEHRRALVRAEMQFVLSQRRGSLWPEPIDLLEVVNTRDDFVFPQASADLEPIAVFSRPHGQLLLQWQKNVLPVASILSVLAELLDFLEEAHRGGMVLQGLGPAALLVDGADRLHFLGSDMVMSQDVSLLEEGSRPERWRFSSAAWRRLFPPERFARGFAAPECFSTEGRPDRRSDLYAWAALAYFLLSGQAPWQLALEQGRPWAQLQEANFKLLEKSLRDIPEGHVAIWVEQLGLSGIKPTWPDNLVVVMRQLLNPEAGRRPGSVRELRGWLVQPPPTPPAAVVAFRTGASEARIFVDYSGAHAEGQFLVTRSIGNGPAKPREGFKVHEGAGVPVIVDAQAPPSDEAVLYSVVARNRGAGGDVYSTAVTSVLMQPTPAKLAELAETEYQRWVGQDAVSPRVRLCFEALEPVAVAEALLGSTMPAVRRWGLERLQKLPPATPRVDGLLWRALKDSVHALRLVAAKAVLAQKPATEDELHRLVLALGEGNVDDALQAAPQLLPLGVDSALMARVVARLEQERPQACPVCQTTITAKERAEHLRGVHGYLEVNGSLLPRAQALARLWDQVLLEGSVQANEHLLALLPATRTRLPTKLGGQKQRPPHPYVVALESVLGSPVSGSPATGNAVKAAPAGISDAATPVSLVNLLTSMRQSRAAVPLVPHLLRSADVRVREVGREVILPLLGERLRRPGTTTQDIRKLLDQCCPGMDLREEKIQLCYRLPQLGVDSMRASLALAQLQEEKPVRCPQCEAWVRAGDVEVHLLAAHQVYQFRKVRRSADETKVVVLESLCGGKPDVQAWKMLEALARTRPGKPQRRLVAWLCNQLLKVAKEARPTAISGLAESIAAGGEGSKILPVLLAPIKSAGGRWVARCLALELAGRMPPPVEGKQRDRIAPYLSDRRYPRQSRQRAVIGLLRSTGKEGPAAMKLLTAYIAQTGKLRAIDKLQELEQLTGQSPAIDSLCQRLEDQVRMSCPRCALQCRRVQMVKHLWEQHRLMLEGRRVREPWKLLEDWVVDYSLEKDAALLKKCRDLAGQLDTDKGLLRLQQLMLRHGIDDPHTSGPLLAQARKQHASLCPRCFHFVPIADVPQAIPLKFLATEMLGHGFRLEVSDHGLVPWLEIETPDEMIYRGREPGRWLTPLGGAILIPGPLVLLIFVATEILTGSSLSSLVLLAIAVVAGVVLSTLTYCIWPRPWAPQDRLVDAAWSVLVPRLLDGRLADVNLAWLVSLGYASSQRGRIALRRPAIDRMLSALKEDIRTEHHPALASLIRLRVLDLFEVGDPVPELVRTLRDVLAGKLPLSLLGPIFDDLIGEDKLLTRRPGRLGRMRVLALEAAFASGLGPADLKELGKVFPPLIGILNLGQEGWVGSMRALWSLRSKKTWSKLGPAETIFDLAQEPVRCEPLLEDMPDLLLVVEDLPLRLNATGARFRKMSFATMPRPIKSEACKEGGYALVLGKESLSYSEPVGRLAEQLEAWLKFHFLDLLPEAAKLRNEKASSNPQRFRAVNGVTCPKCRTTLLPRLGQPGLSVEDKEPEKASTKSLENA